MSNDDKKPVGPATAPTTEIPSAGVMWAAIDKMSKATSSIEKNVALIPNINRNVDLLGGEVKTLGDRVTVLEKRVSVVEKDKGRGAPLVPRPRPSDAELAEKVRQSNANLEMEATLGAIIAHHARVDGAMGELLENDARQDQVNAEQDRMLEAQNTALVVFARELGVEDKLPPMLTRSLPPPAPDAPKPKPVLRALDRRSKLAQIAQVVIALGVIADFLRSLLHK